MSQRVDQVDEGGSLKELYAELRVLQNRRIDVWNRKATMVTAFLGLGAWKFGEGTGYGTSLVALLLPFLCILFDVQLMNTTISIKRVGAFLLEQSSRDSIERKWTEFRDRKKHQSILEKLVADGFTFAVFFVSIGLLVLATLDAGWEKWSPYIPVVATYYAILVIIYVCARCYEKHRKEHFVQLSHKMDNTSENDSGDHPENGSG